MLNIKKIDHDNQILLKNKSVLFIYPHQLFHDNNLLEYCNTIYIIEDPIFFTKYKFHKLKLIYHRSSMKSYYDFIIVKYPHLKNKITYIEFTIDYDNLFSNIKKKYNNIILYNPIDYNLIKKLNKHSKDYKINIEYFDTQTFIETIDDLIFFRENHTNKKNYHHTNFYKWQRKKLNILMDNDKPLYGKWSFDTDNRKKFDSSYINPNEPKSINNDYVSEAILYINKYFSNNFGLITNDNFIYPIDHKSAKTLFNKFVNDKLETYGKYQDASSSTINFGSHSLISILLNVGLLTPKYVIDKTLKYFNDLNEIEKKKIINSVEGFIRQVIGWRSYMYFIYIFHGQDILKMNNFNHKNKLNNSWYEGTTNIEPIDNLIIKVQKYAYLHHIERLMYIGNFSLLCEIEPMEIYKWFMVCFIDSFEWVMVANVMGMSQYSLEDISIMSRPYFSSSNYIIKMSNYKKGEWSKIWDNLYYNFINNNIDMLKSMYSTASSVMHWNKKTIDDKKNIVKNAKLFLK